MFSDGLFFVKKWTFYNQSLVSNLDVFLKLTLSDPLILESAVYTVLRSYLTFLFIVYQLFRISLPFTRTFWLIFLLPLNLKSYLECLTWPLGVHQTPLRFVICPQDFPGGSDSKASAYNVGNLRLIPELGRSSGEENGNSLQYSCLENPIDRGAW